MNVVELREYRVARESSARDAEGLSRKASVILSPIAGVTQLYASMGMATAAVILSGPAASCMITASLANSAATTLLEISRFLESAATSQRLPRTRRI